MIKIIKTRFLSNLDLGCIRILNYAHTWSKPCARILNEAHESFSTDLKSYIFTNLIIQIYKHRNQISILEMLKSKLA